MRYVCSRKTKNYKNGIDIKSVVAITQKLGFKLRTERVGNIEQGSKTFDNKELDTGGKYGCTTCSIEGTKKELIDDGIKAGKPGLHDAVPIESLNKEKPTETKGGG